MQKEANFFKKQFQQTASCEVYIKVKSGCSSDHSLPTIKKIMHINSFSKHLRSFEISRENIVFCVPRTLFSKNFVHLAVLVFSYKEFTNLVTEDVMKSDQHFSLTS